MEAADITTELINGLKDKSEYLFIFLNTTLSILENLHHQIQVVVAEYLWLVHSASVGMFLKTQNLSRERIPHLILSPVRV